MDTYGRCTAELRQLQALVELDADSGGVRLNHAALPRAAERVVFGRCLATHVLPDAVMRLVDPANRSVLLVVGESSSKAPEIAALLDKLRRLADNGTAALRLEVLEVRGHADHHAIRAGIAAVRRSGAGLVVAIGGGTTIDVGKSVAALAYQEDERGTDAFRGRGTGEATGVSANVTKGMGWTADTATGGVGTGGEASAGTAAHSPAGSARAGFQRVATARAHADASADAGTGVGQSRTMPAQPDADVGPAVAADENMDAETEVDVDIAAYQLGRRRVAPERALPWIAVPTTSGTGSESTDNAVIELGDEKKSLRGIPAPRLIIADPALTDSLPLAPTVGAAVDALAQSLEVLTNSAASAEVQEVALAAFATLARGIEDLYLVATSRIGGTGSDSGSGDGPAARGGPEDLAHRGRPSDVRGRRFRGTIPDADFHSGCDCTAGMTPTRPHTDRPDHHPRLSPSPALAASAAEVAATTRDALCWGSLLMGIAFAHARLGLPHALVHFCNRFGLSHGNMVGMLLAPGLAVQARDPETARRLAQAAQALDALLRCGEVPAPEPPISQTSVPVPRPASLISGVPGGSELLFRWLETRIPDLFAATGLPHSLRAAGLTRADLDWIVARELESRPSFGTPARPATPGDLKEVLEKAFDTR